MATHTGISAAKVIKLNDALKRVLQQMPSGDWKYAEESSDATVAKELGLTTMQVRRNRASLFGKLEKTRAGFVPIGKLVMQVQELQEQMATLQRKVILLEADLGVVDVINGRGHGASERPGSHLTR